MEKNEQICVDNLQECKYEVQDEIDKLSLAKKKGENVKKERIQLLWEEVEYVSSLINYVSKGQGVERDKKHKGSNKRPAS